jgi:phosphoglycerate kinase
MDKLRTIRNIRVLRDKRVLLRIDANVPVEDGRVVDDFRLWAVRPTIEYLTGRGAVVVVIAHLGRPEGKRQEKFTLKPIAQRLSQILGRVVTFVPALGGATAERALASAVPGQVLMLENLRFDRGEESNSGSFAKKLSSLGDIYVNDGFAVSHRAHASVSAITRFLPSYAGLLMERELKVLDHVRTKPRSPSVAIVGGAKINTKLGLIKRLAKIYDYVLVGGGLVDPILVAKKFEVGASFNESVPFATLAPLLKLKNLVLPVDLLVGNPDKPAALIHAVPIATDTPFVICRKPEGIIDIGPRTMLAWGAIIRRAKTIVWNGPLGIFEVPRFSHGTMAIAQAVASRSKGKALGVVGGGETVEALDRTGMAKWVDHVSTGGGAMLEFLEGKVLPGVKPLYGKLKKSF